MISSVSARDVFGQVVERLQEVKRNTSDKETGEAVELLFEVGLSFEGLRSRKEVADGIRSVGGWMVRM